MDLRWLPQNGHHAQKIGERALKKLLGMVAVLMLLGTAAQAAPEKIIIDTDIGDDIDDAFAMALALKSPELQVLGMISDFGDTPMRSRMLDRLLADTGHKDIPVATGIASSANLAGFSQRRYAEGAPAKTHPAGVDFLLDQIRRHPGEITLVVPAVVTVPPIVPEPPRVAAPRETALPEAVLPLISRMPPLIVVVPV